MRVCSIPGCPTIYAGRKTRCPKHEAEAEARHTRKGKGYGTRAHRLGFRATVLARDPICTLCHRAEATDADHYPVSRIDLIAAGLNPNDPQYGRGLCHSCHSKETAASPTQRGGWNARD